MIKYFFAVSISIFLAIPVCKAQQVDSIARAMFDKTRKIKTLTYDMTREELYEGDLIQQSSFIKLQRNPFKVYSRQLTPKEGLEVLYIEGDETALINPNGFPWFNIKLDPFGSRMTKGQHHTIKDPGFDRFIDILEFMFDKYHNQIEKIAKVEDIRDNGREYWKLTFKNPDFKSVKYVVKEGETIWDIGYSHFASPYMILMMNDLEDYYDLSAGDEILIPNAYSPRMILKIDKQLLVPTDILVYYQSELFEHYSFDNIKINLDLKDEEFTPEYHEYGF